MPSFQIPDPWQTSNYLQADIFIWITVILCAVWAFFLYVEYFKTRKTFHLVFAIVFTAATILFHQITFIGSFSIFGKPLWARITLFIPGGFAAGLLYSAFDSKKLANKISYGTSYIIMVIISSIIIALLIIYKEILNINNNYYLVMIITNTISSAIIIGVPLYTTLKTKETSKIAYFVMAYGFLAGAGGICMSVAVLGMGDPYFVIGLYSYFLILSKTSIAFGMLFEKKWTFSILSFKVTEGLLKYIGLVIFFPIMICFIHELGHIIATIIVGGEILSMSIQFGLLGVSVSAPTPLSMIVIAISGSLFLLAIFSLLMFIAFKKDWIIIYGVLFLGVLFESISWIIGYSDSFVLAKYSTFTPIGISIAVIVLLLAFSALFVKGRNNI